MSDQKRASATPPRFRVPETAGERQELQRIVARYAEEQALTPPLLREELELHAGRAAKAGGIAPEWLGFVQVQLNNAVWRPVIETVPPARRTLLLPPCLRSATACKAEFDELGLLCDRCGLCPIASLSDLAEDMGYRVLVAEGTSTVATLVKRGTIDAVIGVSCMDALERTFGAMVDAAVPGMAIPLLTAGCSGTTVDSEWVRSLIALPGREPVFRLPDARALRSDMALWFEEQRLARALGAGNTDVERLSIEWLARAGKRWRPVLVSTVYRALCPGEGALPERIERAGLAVECIHKASLILDDIQDGDLERYGEPTVHAEHGVAVGMAVGLYLLGQGYRLLAGIPLQGGAARILDLAARGHCELAVGQGRELWWMRHPTPLTVRETLSLFEQKTAPSFDVVFRLGAMCAGADEETLDALGVFSRALGVGYQIRDDLEDGAVAGDMSAGRPTILPALAYEQAEAGERSRIAEAFASQDEAARRAAIRELIARHEVEPAARALMDRYREEALRGLASVRSVPLKVALFRLARLILEPARDEEQGEW